MTLFRQIQIFVAVLLTVMLAIVLKINFDNTKEFVRTQLYSNSKNTANSLSLSLSAVTDDQAMMTAMLRAMFDGGYFEQIMLTDAQGNVIENIHQEALIEGVPEFFVDFVNFENVSAEAQISNGWSIFGTLSVKGHPGLSYIRLWDTFRYLSLWFLAIGVLSLMVTNIVLRFIFRPLKSVQRQAEAIENNEFIINEKIPATPEMKQVVTTMNSMVAKAKVIYDREIEALKNYQELLYKDQQTGLYNRRFFMKQLGHFLQSEDENSSGELMIIAFDGLEDATMAVGHHAVNDFFSFCRDTLLPHSEKVSNSVAAFLNQKEFGIILPGADKDTSLNAAKDICAKISAKIAADEKLHGVLGVFCGAAGYSYEENLGSVLSKVDYSVTVAKSRGSGSAERFKDDGQVVLGKLEWKNMIEEALKNNRFVLTSQSVMSDNGELHQEIYINMVDAEGVVQKAGYFMPMVISLNLANDLDRYVLEKTVEYLGSSENSTLAINITDMFLNDRASFTWFRKLLISARHLTGRLTFEISDSAIKNNLDICLDFAGLIKGLGFSFGVDRFEMSQQSLENLQQLKPDYMKVDHEYLIDTDAGEVAAALKSLQTITESLGIKLIATKIDNEELRRKLESNNIKYFQGRGVADINPLDR
jgi:EAL domain-containing protein (putative c-di-GMP-specific phosphodiesterase class I)/GGDEF domain-containing protein